MRCISDSYAYPAKWTPAVADLFFYAHTYTHILRFSPSQQFQFNSNKAFKLFGRTKVEQCIVFTFYLSSE